MKDEYGTSDHSSDEHTDGTLDTAVVKTPDVPFPRGTTPAEALRRPWYVDHGYLLGGWTDGDILEAFGTAFYVYVSGNISATLASYGIRQTGAYTGIGNMALLSLFIYATSSSTGGHLNPLVTFSAIFAGVLPVSKGILYLLGQALGGALGGGVLTGVYGNGLSIQVRGSGCYYDPSVISSGQVFLNELFASLAYLFLSYGVGLDPKQGLLFGPRLAPLLAGSCLGLVTFATSGALPGYTGAQMNPARCFGFGIARRDMSGQWIWWFAPAAAGLVLAFLFNFAPLHGGEKDAGGRRHVKPSGRKLGSA
ncbi:related to aquaporin [Cephalotrichum gorgonifer]|uniref:Related to aquaporin n=1 Tax=Cephalotrichum gorgonifer TaxID=2041049 RepID=A0AAE8N2A1_9PEZI|nr:related to aquaporin [Cephalotrichum gorgonifer]